MTKIMSASILAVITLFCVSCSSTPIKRIDKHPELFAPLTNQQKELVMKGRISKGMPPSAVFLAWGQPDSVAEGNFEGRQSVRWIYRALQPVVTPRWGGGYYGGWGRPYWGRGYYGGFYDDITYIPVDAGYVLFINDAVDSWEKRNN